MDEGKAPVPAESGQGSGQPWRTQPPPDHRPAAALHPGDSGGCRQVSRVGFHDERIRIPAIQPGRQTALPAKVKRAAQQVQVMRRDKPGGSQPPGWDGLSGKGFPGENAQACCTGRCQRVEKCGAVGRQHALLHRQLSMEAEVSHQWPPHGACRKITATWSW